MKAKRSSQKKYKKKEKSTYKHKNEICGVFLFMLGSLTLLSMHFKIIGIFGEGLRSVFTGMFGITSFFIAPVIIFYSIFLMFKRNYKDFNLKFLSAILLLLIVSAITQIFYYNTAEYENMRFLYKIAHLYKTGNQMHGGGILGGFISLPLISIFQAAGTFIILFSILIANIMFLTGISIASTFSKLKLSIISLFINAKSYKNPTAEQNKSNVTNGHKISITGLPESNFKVIDFNEKRLNNLKEANIKEKEIVLESSIEKGTNNKDEEIEQAKNELDIAVKMHNISNVQYNFPDFDLLEKNTEGTKDIKGLKAQAIEGAQKLEDTLKSFGVDAKVINISRGPAVTRYEIQPSSGVKVSKIVNLSDDISLNLAASGIRIEAPIPGKAAIGIEVPNKIINPVYLRDVIESPEFVNNETRLAFALGKDISGKNIIADIGKMPHLLIAGATGSGKSVCVNSLIISLIYKASPDEVKLLMVDPKVVELKIYNGIPHLLIPVVTDPKKAAGALNWAVQEMTNRYKAFADKGVRDIRGYNEVIKRDQEGEKLPQIVIIIDELADLMMVAPNDVEDAICRLAQMARAAGMHLVIATQRPSVDVITGIIKANIPSRISFAVSSQIDSRTILDMAGAEKLLGRGDMLFYPVGEPKPVRIKGAFVSDKEVERIVEFVKKQGNVDYNNDIIEEINSIKGPKISEEGDDEFLPLAIEMVVEAGQASTSLIQRKFKVGYARAARIVDQMEERGIIGKSEGSKPRQVLMTRQKLQELRASGEQ